MEFTIPVGLFQKLIKNYMMFQPHFSVRLFYLKIFCNAITKLILPTFLQGEKYGRIQKILWF